VLAGFFVACRDESGTSINGCEMRRKTTQPAPLTYTADNGARFLISKMRGQALWRYECVNCGASETTQRVSDAMHSVQEAEQLADKHSLVCPGRTTQ
jgi:hypothetical protein